jgi:S1-C subfamily serine protease
MPGDVIVAFNGQPMIGVPDLQQQLNSVRAGSIVTAVVWRNHLERQVQVQF